MDTRCGCKACTKELASGTVVGQSLQAVATPGTNLTDDLEELGAQSCLDPPDPGKWSAIRAILLIGMDWNKPSCRSSQSGMLSALITGDYRVSVGVCRESNRVYSVDLLLDCWYNSISILKTIGTGRRQWRRERIGLDF